MNPLENQEVKRNSGYYSAAAVVVVVLYLLIYSSIIKIIIILSIIKFDSFSFVVVVVFNTVHCHCIIE
jgi:hypothetical protein